MPSRFKRGRPSKEKFSALRSVKCSLKMFGGVAISSVDFRTLSTVVFVTVERVVVLGDERSNERWFGLPRGRSEAAARKHSLYERCVPSKKLGEFAEPSRVGREKIGVFDENGCILHRRIF